MGEGEFGARVLFLSHSRNMGRTPLKLVALLKFFIGPTPYSHGGQVLVASRVILGADAEANHGIFRLEIALLRCGTRALLL